MCWVAPNLDGLNSLEEIDLTFTLKVILAGIKYPFTPSPTKAGTPIPGTYVPEPMCRHLVPTSQEIDATVTASRGLSVPNRHSHGEDCKENATLSNPLGTIDASFAGLAENVAFLVYAI